MFGCACAFAIHILVTERAVRRHDVAALVAVQLTFCGVVCLVAAALAGDLETPRGATVWSALLVTSLLASALGFIVQSYAQRTISSARTALILAAEPAFAGLFGYLLQDDRLSAAGWCGAALILGAIVAVDAIPRLRPPRPLPGGLTTSGSRSWQVGTRTPWSSPCWAGMPVTRPAASSCRTDTRSPG